MHTYPLPARALSQQQKQGAAARPQHHQRAQASTLHPTGKTTLHSQPAQPSQISRTQHSATNPHNFLSEYACTPATHPVKRDTQVAGADSAQAHKLQHSCSGVRYSTHAEANRQHHNDPSSACPAVPTSRNGTRQNGCACWVLLAAANPWVGKWPVETLGHMTWGETFLLTPAAPSGAP